MFSGLQARLLISYVVVIIVCLALAGLTLILVARPIQQRLNTARLAGHVTLTIPRVQTLLDRGLSPEQIAARLGTVTTRRGTRLLLMDKQGRVLGDSEGEWEGQLVGDVPRTGDGQPPSSGTMTGPDGSRLVYAGGVAGQKTTSPLWVAAVAPSPGAPSALLGELGQGLLTSGLVALILSVLLAALITRSVARPLRQIAQASEAIAAGKYDQTLDIKGPREVRVLAESFESMAQQVKASQQAMRDLVANVSHDLKTPLTSIQGFAQALLEGATQDEAARQRAASVIYDEASRMVRMVEELLDLARIESGQMMLDRQLLDLSTLVSGVVQTLAPVAAAKKVTLQAELLSAAEPNGFVWGDGDRLAQVFTNLLDNALKYTAEGDRVQVTAQILTAQVRPQSRPQSRPRRVGILGHPNDSAGQPATQAGLPQGAASAPTFVEISISDTGRGISAQDLPRVFERFYQADKARTSRRGSGLGLAIAKEIIEAHGGRISVESVEGLGTRFVVALPAADSKLEPKAGVSSGGP